MLKSSIDTCSFVSLETCGLPLSRLVAIADGLFRAVNSYAMTAEATLGSLVLLSKALLPASSHSGCPVIPFQT